MTVNGNLYDWEGVEIQLPNGVAIGITEISYNDERSIEERYGKGGVPRGYGRKNYKASGSMTLDRDEYQRFQSSINGSAYNTDPFIIIVSYGSEGMETIIDTLPDCKITKVDTSTKQDDGNTSAVKLDFTILSPIKWDGTPAY